MSQADLIREHARKRYVEVARRAHQETVTIVAGEVGRDLGLSNRMPNICQALQSRKFLEMAGVRLLDIQGPEVGASTRFRYAIEDSQPSSGGESQLEPIRANHSPPPPRPAPTRTANERDRSPSPSLEGAVVIQCAASKDPNAGSLATADGNPVLFVADPATAPRRPKVEYRHPDDLAPSGLSWRDELVQYNETYRAKGANPLGLLPAWRLYANPAYKHLVNRLGEDKVFILSAGWGLISAPFLTPDYDITFSGNAEAYKRRRNQDRYADFSMLPKDPSHPIHFVGGKSYVSLFLRLTAGTDAERVIHYVGDYPPPPAPNCRGRRFETNRRTNWHYECAMTLW